jgi:hypothetical protein
VVRKRVINVKVLSGEPLDGSGRSCIHLFVQDEKGLFVEPHVLHPAVDEQGHSLKKMMVAKPTRGRLACDKRRGVASVTRGNVITITARTNDPQAVTCVKCRESKEYKLMMATPSVPTVPTSDLTQLQGER